MCRKEEGIDSRDGCPDLPCRRHYGSIAVHTKSAFDCKGEENIEISQKRYRYQKGRALFTDDALMLDCREICCF